MTLRQLQLLNTALGTIQIELRGLYQKQLAIAIQVLQFCEVDNATLFQEFFSNDTEVQQAERPVCFIVAQSQRQSSDIYVGDNLLKNLLIYVDRERGQIGLLRDENCSNAFYRFKFPG